MSQLEGKGGEDEMEADMALRVARTKGTHSQWPSSEDSLANRPGDRGLANAGEPIQPEDERLVKVFSPQLDLVRPVSRVPQRPPQRLLC